MKEIPLTQGLFAIVDDEDYERVMDAGTWHILPAKSALGGFYAKRTFLHPTRNVQMHRFILDAPRGTEVDHVNRNGLDNRRSNLRLCTHGQNMANARRSPNKSGYRGVIWCKHRSKWIAQISRNGRSFKVGRFDDPAEAARCRDRAVLEMYGPFATLNFPDEAAKWRERAEWI